MIRLQRELFEKVLFDDRGTLEETFFSLKQAVESLQHEQLNELANVTSQWAAIKRNMLENADAESGMDPDSSAYCPALGNYVDWQSLMEDLFLAMQQIIGLDDEDFVFEAHSHFSSRPVSPPQQKLHESPDAKLIARSLSFGRDEDDGSKHQHFQQQQQADIFTRVDSVIDWVPAVSEKEAHLNRIAARLWTIISREYHLLNAAEMLAMENGELRNVLQEERRQMAAVVARLQEENKQDMISTGRASLLSPPPEPKPSSMGRSQSARKSNEQSSARRASADGRARKQAPRTALKASGSRRHSLADSKRQQRQPTPTQPTSESQSASMLKHLVRPDTVLGNNLSQRV
eukprot:CAMPEP_0184340870 /NCGR_PEP_ID=MMETSP1089-20130417/9512_1 /TAXON_ID=38269 ORGANISM="Gloeochaete wittrockiana, Strain SAG46.84" /NCGR_SAMPLE_ID=MMETSP1089 /ASSEMBLY_ACC=CAM_ASM_000445 /LENGTH=345 /DNA_ID=CAMNT_0026668881 /DNA_START=265 /DNA_END=1302 /DNA_ORIENTATION=-